MTNFLDWLMGGAAANAQDDVTRQAATGIVPQQDPNAAPPAPDVTVPATPPAIGGNRYGGNRYGGNTYGGQTFGGQTFGGNQYGASAPQPDPNAVTGPATLPPMPAQPDRTASDGLPIGPNGLPVPNISAMLANLKNAQPTPLQNAPVSDASATAAPQAPAAAALVPPQGDNLPPLPPSQEVAANVPAAAAPLAPAADASAPAAPSATPAGRSLLDRIMGSDDASTKDARGLTEADRHGVAFEGLAKLGFGIMAASMPQNPNQRAQAIAQLGSVPADMLKQRAAIIGQNAVVQQQAQRKQLMDQRQAGIDYLRSPDAQKVIETMPGPMQGIAKVIANSGDIAAFSRLAQGTATPSQPRNLGNGNVYVPNQNGQPGGNIVNSTWGTSTPVGAAPGAGGVTPASGGAPAADGAQPSGAQPNTPQPNGAQPGEPQLNDAAIARLSPDMQGLVQGVAAGEMDIPFRTGPDRAKFEALVKAYDPSYSQHTYTSRQAYVKGEAGSGKRAATTLASGTFISHADQLSQDYAKLNMADGALSNITNPVEAAKLKIQRDARYAAVQTGIAPVMDEFATVMGGGQGTDSLRKTYETQLAAAKSPQEFNAILGTMAERMKGRLDTLEADRKRIMGPHAKGGELLSPEAQAGYGRLIAAKEKAYADSDARIRGTAPAAPQGQAPAAGQYTPDQLTAIQAEARKRGL